MINWEKVREDGRNLTSSQKWDKIGKIKEENLRKDQRKYDKFGEKWEKIGETWEKVKENMINLGESEKKKS